MSQRFVTWALLMALAAGTARFATAQDAAPKKEDAPPAAEKQPDAPAAPEKKPDDATPPTPEKKPDDAPPPAAPAMKPAAAEFAKQFEAWKTLLKELREMQVKYQLATPAEGEKIRQDYAAKIEGGRAALVTLRAAAVAAFIESPNEDRQLSRFLIKLVADDIKLDKYEDAATLAKTLVEHKCDERELNNLAGIAAFCTNDFAAAEVYFKAAGESNTLSEDAKKYQELLTSQKYVELWKAEEELRAKEAAADDLPRVKFTTSKGDIVLELFENEAPGAVGNFVSLVEKGFYNGLTFHRVLPAFMAQGGDPKGDGTGGPGYNIYCECYQPNHRKHFRGSLSMAHAGKNTGGSQFFLTFVPTGHLNGLHTVFGRVIEGMDVLAKLRREPKGPDEADKIVTAEVIRKRDHKYQPNIVEAGGPKPMPTPPTTPPTTPSTPATPETPKAPAAPETPKAPATEEPKAPAAETPKTPDQPAPPPATPESPDKK